MVVVVEKKVEGRVDVGSMYGRSWMQIKNKKLKSKRENKSIAEE